MFNLIDIATARDHAVSLRNDPTRIPRTLRSELFYGYLFPYFSIILSYSIIGFRDPFIFFRVKSSVYEFFCFSMSVRF